MLPKADALKALSGSLFKGGEGEAQGEPGDLGLMQLDAALLRAQLRGSKLLDALRIYRQGERAASNPALTVGREWQSGMEWNGKHVAQMRRLPRSHGVL